MSDLSDQDLDACLAARSRLRDDFEKQVGVLINTYFARTENCIRELVILKIHTAFLQHSLDVMHCESTQQQLSLFDQLEEDANS